MSNIFKSLKTLSWDVPEEEYRKDPAISYSTLSTFLEGGYEAIKNPKEMVSPSLTFGSAVDAILTGGMDEFNNRFVVINGPNISSTMVNIVKSLFQIYSSIYISLSDIPDDAILTILDKLEYQKNWKPVTRIKDVREKGSEYYDMLYLCEGKTVLNKITYDEVCSCVRAIKTSKSTAKYFSDDFDNSDDMIEHLYQLKFKIPLENGIIYRCMIDKLIVNHRTKVIQPIDLKTSSTPEWDFYKSFVKWNYQIQNRLYYRILRKIISEDDYFKDFFIEDFIDIVVSKYTLCPLVWKCSFTKNYGDLTFGKRSQIYMKDPETIAAELMYQIRNESQTPIGIVTDGYNHLEDWLNNIN